MARAVLSASLPVLALVGVGAGELDEGVDELYISDGTDQDFEVSLARTTLLRLHIPGSIIHEEGTVNAVSTRRAAIVEGRSMQDSLSNASACLIVDDIFVNKLVCRGI